MYVIMMDEDKCLVKTKNISYISRGKSGGQNPVFISDGI